MPTRRTPFARRLHRDQHEPPPPRTSSLSTTRAEAANTGSRSARARSNGHGCRLSRRSFAAKAVRLQLHALASNLGNFLRTLATPELIKDWSLTTLKEKADQDRREGRRPRALCRVPDGRGRDFEEPVRRESTNDRGVAASAGRINRVRRQQALRAPLKLTADVRHDGAGLDGVHRATAVPDASSASGRYGTGNPIEKIANTGHLGRRRRRHPANVG